MILLMSFIRTNDPLTNLGVGNKALISQWLDKNGVENSIINNDLTIDIPRHVYIDKNPDILFDPINFGIIDGFFVCHRTNLTKVSVKKVSGSFICINNPELKFIEYHSDKVEIGGDFVFYGNEMLLSLRDVKDHFEISGKIILEKPQIKF